MEQVLERGTVMPKVDWRDIEMYYDDGRRITNPDILQGMFEAQELAEEWERRIERSNLDEIFGKYDEEDEDFDTQEED